MSSIYDLLAQIKNAVYGKDVRNAIHDSIEQCYDDATGTPESIAGAVADIQSYKEQTDASISSYETLINSQIGNLVAELNPDKVVTLWSGTGFGKHEDSVRFSGHVRDYDFLDIYVQESYNPIRVKVKNNYAKLFLVRTSATGDNHSFYIDETDIYFNTIFNVDGIDGNDITEAEINYTYHISIFGSGTQGYYFNDDVSHLNITKVDGIKIASDVSAEIVDIRVGEDGTVYQTAGAAVRGQIADVKADLQDIIDHGTGGGMSAEFKQALHNIFEKVAYIDGNGQDYLDALDDAMSSVTAISLNTSTLSFSSLNSTQTLVATTTPSGGSVSWSSSNTSVATVSSSGVVTSVGYGTATITASAGSVSASCSVVVAQATLVSISCVYTQSGTVYESTSLDSLKSDLVVTATWNDSTTSTVASTDYELSGTLTEGTSTITVTYGGKTTTFNVTVSSANNYVAIGNPTISNGILTVENGKYVRSNYALSPTSGQSWKIRQKLKYNNLPSGFVNIIGGSGDDAFYKSFVIQQNNQKQYIFYVSADGSNWTVSNQYTGSELNFNTTDWFYVEFGYNGTQYYITIRKDGWDGALINSTAHKEYTSSAVMINGKYVGFGVTSTVSGFDGQIDLNDCSIYVNDVLVWQAIAS